VRLVCQEVEGNSLSHWKESVGKISVILCVTSVPVVNLFSSNFTTEQTQSITEFAQRNAFSDNLLKEGIKDKFSANCRDVDSNLLVN